MRFATDTDRAQAFSSTAELGEPSRTRGGVLVRERTESKVLDFVRDAPRHLSPGGQPVGATVSGDILQQRMSPGLRGRAPARARTVFEGSRDLSSSPREEATDSLGEPPAGRGRMSEDQVQARGLASCGRLRSSALRDSR